MSWEVRRSRIDKKGGGVHGVITYAVIFVRSLVALVAICSSAYKEPVEGLDSLVGLVVLEKVSELCEERPVGVGVFCAVSREEEGVQQQVLRKDLMQQVLNIAAYHNLGTWMWTK